VLLAAYSEGRHEVTTRHVKTAAHDSEFSRPRNLKPVFATVMIAASLAFAFWIGATKPWSAEPAQNQAMQASEPDPAPVAQTSAAVEPVTVVEETTIAAKPVQTQIHAESEPELEAPAEEEKTLSQLVSPGRIKPSLLDTRLTETLRWLQQAEDNHYSIQLFMTRIDDATAVEGFLRNAPESLVYEKIYVYETRVGDSRMYGVVYADFDTRRSALSIISSLPDDMQANKPFLRRIRTLRKDIASS